MQTKLFKILPFSPVIGLALGFNASAQQTIANFSICDKAEVSLEGGSDNATLPALCDKNDMTVFEVAKTGGVNILFTLADAWVAKGLVVVAADDTKCAPAQMTLYGRNAATEEWTRLGLFNRAKYWGAYTAYTGKTFASQTGAYTSFKLEIAKNGEGDKLSIADLQILGYRAEDTENIATDVYGVFTAPEGTDNLHAIGGGNYTTPVTLKNVKAENGLENAWIDYTFNDPAVLTGYALTTNQSAVTNTRPNTWDLMASEDGENWVTLDMRNNEGSFNVDNYQQRYDLPSTGVKIDYAAMAEELYSVMLSDFYRDYWGGKYLIHSWNPNPEKVNAGYNYWWQAHAIDAMTDAFIRTGKQIWRMRAMQIKKGMYTAYDAGRQDLWNSFYDDMEWMAIACLRAYEHFTISRNEWLTEAKQLFDWIWGGWSDVNGGGIAWNTGTDGKNSCSNAPAIIVAARLYKLTGEQHYLDKAKMIYEWMLTHSRFDDGFIKDAPGNEQRGWAFTYNQGTWVGGLLELFKITGEEEYRDIAVDLMDKSLDGRWYSPNGIMREQGHSDGGLFKGIYIRYIAEWVASGLLDSERQFRYAKYLVENAKSLYLSSLIKPNFKVMPCWKSREDSYNGENNGGPNGDYHSSILLSGVFLFESVDMLRREGVLDDDYSVKNPNIGKPYKYYRLRVTDNTGGSTVQLGGMSLYGEVKGAGLGGVAAGKPAPVVSGGNGRIDVAGVLGDTDVEVFTPDGRLAASRRVSSGSCSFGLASGLYVVKVGGCAPLTAKVLVK